MKNWKLLILPFLVTVASFIFPFVYWPEMLNWPFILDRGWLPYRDFSIIHTPLLPISLTAFYEVFGFQPAAMHLFGTLLIFLANLAVVFAVKKLTKSFKLALFAGLVHGFLVLAFEGNTVWFESMLTPLLVLIFLIQLDLLKKLEVRKVIFSGFLMGLVLLIKQTAFFVLPEFLIILGYHYLIKKTDLKTLVKFFFAFSIPFLVLISIFLGILYRLNILNDFIAWGVTFPFLLPSIKQPGIEPDLLLPTFRQTVLLGFFCLTILLSVIKIRNITGIFLGVWATLSLLFVYPRFEYFHLVPFSAFYAILVGFAFSKIHYRLFTLMLLIIGILLTVPIFRGTLRTGQRFLNSEVLDVSSWIVENYPGSSMFSLNGPDFVYLLTKKTPAVRPWVDQLPWEMVFAGEKFSCAFISSRPEIIVFRPYLTKPVNGLGAYQPREIVKFVGANYHVVKTFPEGVQILKIND